RSARIAHVRRNHVRLCCSNDYDFDLFVGGVRRSAPMADASSASPRASAAFLTGPHRAPARAMLRASGFTDRDFTRPIIGVANTWIEMGPCNLHLRALAEPVKQAIRDAGATPVEFHTVSRSDVI